MVPQQLSLCFLLFWACACAQAQTSRPDPEFQVIAYHDVRDFVRDDIDADQYAISTARLIEHFSWLRANNFMPVSIEDIVRARDGRQSLPTNAVLLTFDDGFRSAYTHVFPLLKLFDYPAVISVVTGWIDGDTRIPADIRSSADRVFLTWDEIVEMQRSGLVEIASHSHALHQGIIGNPQGNEQPAAVTREFRSDSYESEDEYVGRVRADLRKSVLTIAEHTGRRPRVMTWPYGAYNEVTRAIARELGMPITMSLDSGLNTVGESAVISRHLALGNPEFQELALDLLYPTPKPVVRVAQVDLDYIYDPDPAQQERNLGMLLDRIKALQISHVFLQAYADPDADGGAQSVYFPNRHLPVRADLFNRAAWQLKTRSNVLVYGWLPVLSFDSEAFSPGMRVMQIKDGIRAVDPDAEPRLSVFDADVRTLIAEIYEDLAVYAPLDGILFHDDARLNEFEDANPAALRAYRRKFGGDFEIPGTVKERKANPDWVRFRSAAIDEFTLSLAAKVKRYRPNVRTARNLFAAALMDPDAEDYLAQNFDSFLASYDFVALMAMPYFDAAPDAEKYFEKLTRAVGQRADGFRKTIFELQTIDWRTATPIASRELSETMRWLQANGVKHIGYYPDDFVNGLPELEELRRGMSLATFPLGGRQ